MHQITSVTIRYRIVREGLTVSVSETYRPRRNPEKREPKEEAPRPKKRPER